MKKPPIQFAVALACALATGCSYLQPAIVESGTTREDLDRLEMLDDGRFKGLVVQDSTNKRNVTGFVYLAQTWGNDLEPSVQRAIFELVETINEVTDLHAEVDDHLALDSRDIFRAPFVYIAAEQAFEPTQWEIANLGDYLRQGGFAFVEAMVDRSVGSTATEFTPAEASLREMFRRALGRDARFRMLRNDHAIYHSFYDLDGPPPQRTHSVVRFGRDYKAEKPFLEGIFLGERLAVVFSTKEYGRAWEKEFRNKPQLQMGVNLVVFALTQEGSIAQQRIDFYADEMPLR